jgi:hypothetical protein
MVAIGDYIYALFSSYTEILAEAKTGAIHRPVYQSMPFKNRKGILQPSQLMIMLLAAMTAGEQPSNVAERENIPATSLRIRMSVGNI